MKLRKAASFAMAACLTLPLAFSLTSCSQMNEEKWVEQLSLNNFLYSNRIRQNSFCITNHTVESEGTIYFTEEKDGQTVYYAGDIIGDGINRRYETVELSQTDYEAETAGYTRDAVAPFLDFCKDNFNAFTKIESYHYYIEGESVPAEIDAWLDNELGHDYDFYSIEANCWEGEIWLQVFNNKAADRFGDDYDLRNELINQQLLEIMNFGKLYSAYHYDKAIDTAKEEGVKVVGGEGADYMEIYFKDGMMRYYTPNQTLEDGNVDCVFACEDGVYKFYLKKKNAPWSVQVLEKDVWEQRVNQIYSQYAGGYLISYYGLERNGSKFTLPWSDGLSGEAVSLWRLHYNDIEVVMNDDITQLVSTKWTLQLKSESEFAQDSAKYKFTLTVDKNLTITVPTV